MTEIVIQGQERAARPPGRGGTPRLNVRLLAALLLLAPAAARAQLFPDEVAAAPSASGARPVVVGADRDYPPYEFLDRNGQPAGFNVDLTRAIAEVMGMTVEFRFGSWAEIRRDLMAGRIDVLQGISYSDERARELAFAAPHAIVHHAIFARRDSKPVASLDELRGKRVIVFGGGIMDDTLTQRGMGADLVRTGTPADALRLLASGREDYVALALLPGVYITRELKLSNVVPVARRVASERYGYAVKRGNAELLARFDEGLAILKKTGRYDEIHARWLGVLEPQGPPWGSILRWVGAVAVPLLLVLLGTFAWSRSLQRQVAQRTASLEREAAERRRAVEELRLNQQQLVQAGKMAALGVLVSGVAHEINNPNALILLDVPVVKEAWRDALDALERGEPLDGLTLAGLPHARMREEVPRMLDEMLASGRRIKHIVEELKGFARQEDAARLEPIDVNACARAAARLVANALRKATGRFEEAYAEPLPRVRGNAQRIEQVLVNLLLNASQALPGPDRGIRLSTRLDGARRAVVVEVRDEGVGIPPEHLSRLTDPFFTTRREAGGTGLGLSVSAGIVKEHGGALEFASTPGEGTTAALVLPLPEEASA